MVARSNTRTAASTDRLDTLLERHLSVESRVEKEQNSSQPDVNVLQTLKRELQHLHNQLARYDGVSRTLSRGRVGT